MTVHIGVVVAVRDRCRDRWRRLPSTWPLYMVPINKVMVLWLLT